MSPKRIASEQVAFRIEPELSSLWTDFVADSLIPNRAHLTCAMLMYMSASPAQRDHIQRAYARFQRSGALEETISTGRENAAQDADEMTLLEAFRNADQVARDEAIMNLQEGAAVRVSRNAGSA